MFCGSRRVYRAALFHGASLPRKYISLGGWCGPALMLGKLGLRTEAYPFDFSRVTLDGLMHFIRNGFAEGFYPPGPPPYRPECVGPWVLFRGQHTAFAHFDLNDPHVQAHFQVKMRRFDAVLDSPERPVTFFRTVTARYPQEELALALDLEEAVARRNPSLDFRIVFMVHDQGLRANAVQLAPLSPRVTLWTLQYRGLPGDTLFDRTHTAYRTVMMHSVAESNWPAVNVGAATPPPATVASAEARDFESGALRCDGTIRTDDVPLADLTVARFPWRGHDNLALINGVASVGGTCAGIGSTKMLEDTSAAPQVEGRVRRKCRYCGDATYHAAGRPFRTERPFTDEEDQLVLIHLYQILTGGDKVAAVEKLAHEMQRGTYEVICRIQHLTNSSTKLMDSIDPASPSDS
ncbi:papain-like cysteine peptidase (DUF1796) [Leishmania donovani]|uniref:Putative_papain-like_cysteine_peptidase_(DUF1796) _putative/Pfam:PF08795 n=1 Tax=Leishmania donovani TaxID=5661 RepID=A0A6J8FBK0_LEIDO|nr:papain-like cysteine peptidase (DUF1796) [Leishmania donovani]VDZ43453.1 Putative_papain-like_cysteine_peptidase_(DUF1796)_putative/Pfam:PF08795 [Leishmania donovani]